MPRLGIVVTALAMTLSSLPVFHSPLTATAPVEEEGAPSPANEQPTSDPDESLPALEIERLLGDFDVSDCSSGISTGPCYSLTKTHLGQGQDPQAIWCAIPIIPCPEPQFYAEATVFLKADPDPGWKVQRWINTENDKTNNVDNVLTMPARDETVTVVYVEEEREERKFFDSGFEIADFADWSGEACNPCNEFAASIRRRESSFPLGNGYSTDRRGLHLGRLRGPTSADLDLYLWWWNGSDWVTVASANSPSPEERIGFVGGPGRYNWEVRSASGGGTYALRVAYPGLDLSSVNHLERSERARKKGDFGLNSIYVGGAKGLHYLIDDTPGEGESESDYTIEFQIRPTADLFMRGSRHQIMQLRQRNGTKTIKLLEVFLKQVKGKEKRYAIQVRPRVAGKKTRKSDPIEFGAGGWTTIRVEWKAAAPGQRDGFVRISRPDAGQAWDSDLLANPDDRVDQLRFGQVTKGSKRTSGEVFFDNLSSKWGN